MDYVSHPLIKEGSVERRLYQETILASAVKDNTLVVLPTGIGKTIIAVLAAAHFLDKQGGKFLIMAPTKPLVEQHRNSFSKFLEIGSGDLKVFTGKSNPEKREKEYSEAVGVFATPQVIQNDVISGKIDLSKFSLLIVDECHRAVKDYPYPFIAEMFVKRSSGKILGLTASPGGTREKINEICKNLFVKNVEIRTEKDSDVSPYIQKVNIEWRTASLPKEFKETLSVLGDVYRERLQALKAIGAINSVGVRRKDLLLLQGQLSAKIKDNDPLVFQGISLVAEALKIEHGIMLLETQGSKSLLEYMKRLREQLEQGKSKAVKRLMSDARVTAIFNKVHTMVQNGMEHPKIGILNKVLDEQFLINPNSKVIVFSQYRDSVSELVKIIAAEGRRPVAFVGQKDGLTQKEQMEIIRKFSGNEYNCLVCTSIGEEGLDIPAVDLVVFYEPVSSEIRSIQRRGRTGRQSAGHVIILMASGTRDEAYYWISRNHEKKMKETLKSFSSGQMGLRDF
ncbi:MAG: DEAD/DEAH box helicase [Candidatus Aenigmarchaeota archaeon]|nr:DEAD/DEAH box helicase [Candidatus Aenigmarchaeota archaeon]